MSFLVHLHRAEIESGLGLAGAAAAGVGARTAPGAARTNKQ